MSTRESLHLPLLTERLELRDFREGDVDSVHAWACDPEVVRFMGWGPNTVEQTREFLQRKFAERTARPRRTWDLAVVRRDTGQVIGAVSLRLDESRQQAALGYCYHQEAWGQGFATEAALEMLRFGFEELGLHRIHASTDTRNGASVRVLEKIGMRRRNRLRRHRLVRGEWRDCYLFEILRSEWTNRGDTGQGSDMTDDAKRAVEAFNEGFGKARGGATMQMPEGVKVRMNVAYGTGGEAELTTDLFLPPDGFEAPRPAMLFIHGGGWQGGTPQQFYRQAALLAAKGIVGSCCRYRFSGDAKFPASVHDVKAAVRWLRANAEELNIDTDRIGAMGGSAGGHLAAMLATTAGIEELEGEGGSEGYSSAIHLGVLLNPVTDMTEFVAETNLHPAAVRYLGGTPEEMPERFELASPIRFIDDSTPPCLLLHGTADVTVPYSQSTRFADAMRDLGLRADLILVEDVPHGFFNNPPHFDETWPAIERFVLDVFEL